MKFKDMPPRCRAVSHHLTGGQFVKLGHNFKIIGNRRVLTFDIDSARIIETDYLSGRMGPFATNVQYNVSDLEEKNGNLILLCKTAYAYGNVVSVFVVKLKWDSGSVHEIVYDLDQNLLKNKVRAAKRMALASKRKP